MNDVAAWFIDHNYGARGLLRAPGLFRWGDPYVGLRLGNRRNAAEAAAAGHRALTEEADAFAANVLPIVHSLRAAGVIDLRGLASALNERGVRTARGGRWHVSNVRNLLRRSAALL